MKNEVMKFFYSTIILLIIVFYISPLTSFAEVGETLDKEWTKRDLLISSSTIFAFFGFGSFFITRFENREHLTILLVFLGLALFFIAMIELFQIQIILSIVHNNFDVDFYTLLMVLTITFFCIVLFLVWLIIATNSTTRPLSLIEQHAEDALFASLGAK